MSWFAVRETESRLQHNVRVPGRTNLEKALLLCIVVLVTCQFSPAQDKPRWELFGGFQYARLDTPLALGNRLNLNGWNVSLQENPLNWIGLVFDVGGSYGKKDVNNGTEGVTRLKPSFYTYAAGPQFTYRKNPRFQPFGRVLLGLAYSRVSENMLLNGLPTLTSDVTQKQTCFDFTAGGGIDYHFREHWAARVSADYIRTYFESLNQNNARVSVGLTYRGNGLSTF